MLNIGDMAFQREKGKSRQWEEVTAERHGRREGTSWMNCGGLLVEKNPRMGCQKKAGLGESLRGCDSGDDVVAEAAWMGPRSVEMV
jgi:hypothetical protein